MFNRLKLHKVKGLEFTNLLRQTLEIQTKLNEGIAAMQRGYLMTVILATGVAFSHTTFTIYFGVKAILFNLEEINSKALTNIIWWFILHFFLFSSCVVNSEMMKEGGKLQKTLSNQLSHEKNETNKKLLILTMKNLKLYPIQFSYEFFTFNYQFIGSVS